MKTKQIIYILAFFALTTLNACSDFLDKEPDTRVSLDTPEKIQKLLVSGYLDQNYAVINELSSDNFIDNDSPDEKGVHYSLSSLERMHDEIFAWQPAVSSTDDDSPSAIWNGCYYSIAVANESLEAIKQFEDKGRGSEVSALKGEALLIRAYHYFILVNEFCQTYKNEQLSKTDSGVPYITEPETKVLVKYNRSTVTDTYNNIEKDLLAGIKLLDDTKYDVPKYHFNKNAANAFATRFYLFKRQYNKVVEYATNILGNTPAGYMRNWGVDYSTYDMFAYGWIDVKSNNNFMLLPTYSVFNRIFGSRYGCNRDAAKGTIYGSGPTYTYSFAPCYSGRLYLSGSQEYGLFFPKCGELFEYTDKIAGIGYAHVVRAEFTGEETLLCRAEAYVFLNRTNDAIADLKVFDDSRKMSGYVYSDLTETIIRNFYKSSQTLFVKPFNTTAISPDFVVTDAQKPILDCVLHFRRLETIFDGLRWFDIKRYGIEITHKIGKDVTDVLKYDDDRRAIQIPAEVIGAGLSPNSRIKTSGNNTQIVKASVSLEN